jgi:predicted anti-sigma-YlaC factor YlaD
MPDRMQAKLGAYLDGELDPRGQIEVQAHLETCPACRAELEELRQLSTLLRAAPLPEFTPALDFKAQLMLQLPRRADAPQAHANRQVLAWLAPALVLAGWIFVQVVLGLGTLVSVAHQTGLLDGAAAWAGGAPQQMQWVAIVQSTLGGMLGPQGQAGLTVLNDTGLFVQNLLIPLLLQVGAAVLYWGALALLWRDRVQAWWGSLNAG